MEKIGYFQILPRELIRELYKYFSDYFNGNSLILIDTSTALDHLLENRGILLEFYYTRIHIKFPNTEYSDLIIPFELQFPTLKIFLETIIQEHQFIFIDKKSLRLNQSEIEYNFEINDYDRIYASNLELSNTYSKYVPIHIDYKKVLRFNITTSDEGMSVLYKCTLLQ